MFNVIYPRLERRIWARPYTQGQARVKVERPLALTHLSLGQGHLRILNRGLMPCACDFLPSFHLYGDTVNGTRECDKA
jgi:hypothetical protein